MSDFIRREDVLETLRENLIEMGGDDFSEMGVHSDDIEAIVKNIPTAEPKVGRWKQNKRDVAGEGFFICSCCGNDVYDATNYCPNCGAKMERSE